MPLPPFQKLLESSDDDISDYDPSVVSDMMEEYQRRHSVASLADPKKLQGLLPLSTRSTRRHAQARRQPRSNWKPSRALYQVIDFSSEALKVLKSIHGASFELSMQGQDVINSILNCSLKAIALRASQHAKDQHRSIVCIRDVEAATRALFPGEIGNLAAAAGTNAVLRSA
ncbi:hypothetical protein FA13DRAFT_1798062 [Coprinellus micaceus]|uniref:Histone H2A/H2B/H3 domain-containing protein n=1 Tax=Coprinellus micaceus TaxID=71717 RepID=A0A4Y7SQA6_COPMI|nr:hypothetical protein FA13DRAFT_1798062 [Coprinellus micaceus]